MSWYRTYRPQSVAGLHLETVRQQLQSFMKAGEFPHAILLSGPKGTGKTSSARIIAKVVNCEKNASGKSKQSLQDACLECESCHSISTGSALHVIEIDAASHRRIDDVRELREQIYLPPATGIKNVYIIDEVHMMTNEAFNALLKILEEPPSHAMFILATTEAHKIPETILSRCTTIHFQKPSVEEVTQALQQIAKAEKIAVSNPKLLEQIVQQAQGSFRDAVKVFEQVAKGKSAVEAKDLEQASGRIGEGQIEEFLRQILAKNELEVVAYFQQWQRQDVDATFVHRQILQTLHQHLLRSLGVEPGSSLASTEVVMFLLKAFTQVIADERLPFPLLPIELCALEMILKSKQKGGGSSNTGVASGSSTPSASNSNKSHSSALPTASKPVTTSKPLVASIAPVVLPALSSNDTADQVITPSAFSTSSQRLETFSDNIAVHGDQLQAQWNQFLQLVGQRNISIEALLRSTQFLEGQPGKVVLKVFYGFHKEQLELDRYRLVLEECSAVLLGHTLRFEFMLDARAKLQLTDEANNISGQVEDQGLVQLAEEILV